MRTQSNYTLGEYSMVTLDKAMLLYAAKLESSVYE